VALRSTERGETGYRRLGFVAHTLRVADVELSPGAQLGAYRVLGLLGQGGMGRVYRGRDDRLKRDVALKVLPAEFSADPERVARFQREAEILAALSHPNIAALFGLEEHGGAPALVMELVEGDTLASRISAKPMALEDAIPLARQIVEALDYAHEKNVLHRDLKPANIRITTDGTVKLLDFGLARALDPLEPVGAGPAPADSPTITGPAFTMPGTILGTAAYMSPEQVRGRPLDRRADIWAFGCVLYEMLTGRRAFDGDTVPDTLAAVLKGHADWTRLPAAVPSTLRALLRHCLAPDLKARLRHIADARLLLADGTGDGASTPAPRVSRWATAAFVVGTLGLAAAAWSTLRAPAQAPASASQTRRVVIQLPVPPSRGTTGGGSTLSFSHDGGSIAFVSRLSGFNQVHVHSLTDQRTTAVKPPPNGATGQPVLSPDGRHVASIAADAIWRTAVAGGEAEMLCSAKEIAGFQGFRGGAWSEDGRIVYASLSGLLEVGQPGGPCKVVVPLDAEHEARFLWPQVLPGNRGFILTVSGVSDDPDSAFIAVVRPGESTRTVLVKGARAGQVTPSGHLVFARGTQLLAAPFDLDGLRLSADPVVVLNDISAGLFGGPMMALSETGDLVYAPGGSQGRRLVWVTRDGLRTDAGAPSRPYQTELNLSPDGRRVALPIGIGDHFAWLFTFDTGTLTPLFTRSDSHTYAWSPDSRRIALPWYDRGLAVVDPEASGEPEVVTERLAGLTLSAWSPDGGTVLYSRASPTGGFELVALTLRDRSTRTLVHSMQNRLQANFSPDGRWLAYESDVAGRLEVFVSDYPALRSKVPVSIDGGAAPVWSSDGRELFYLRGATMMAAPRRLGASIAFGRPVALFDGVETTGLQAYSVAPDGRFLLVEDAEAASSSRSQLTLVLNWFDELRQRVAR